MGKLTKEQLEARDKAFLIKKALKIVNELADIDVSSGKFGEVTELIEGAEKLKKDKNWKLY